MHVCSHRKQKLVLSPFNLSGASPMASLSITNLISILTRTKFNYVVKILPAIKVSCVNIACTPTRTKLAFPENINSSACVLSDDLVYTANTCTTFGVSGIMLSIVKPSCSG